MIMGIENFNLITFAISVLSIVFLYSWKEYGQPKLNSIKGYPKVPIPTELILVFRKYYYGDIVSLSTENLI